jgi:hypothetical protein
VSLHAIVIFFGYVQAVALVNDSTWKCSNLFLSAKRNALVTLITNIASARLDLSIFKWLKRLWTSAIGDTEVLTSLNLGELMTADPKYSQLRSSAEFCFTKSVPGAVMNFSEWIPSEQDRVEFGKQVVEELNNKNHPLYFNMYHRRYTVLTVDIW